MWSSTPNGLSWQVHERLIASQESLGLSSSLFLRNCAARRPQRHVGRSLGTSSKRHLRLDLWAMGQTTCRCSKEQPGAGELIESGPPLVIAAPGLAKMGRDLALKLGAHAQGQRRVK